MRAILLTTAAVIGLALASPASADVTITAGNAQYFNVDIAANVASASSYVGDIGNTGEQMTFNSMLGPWLGQGAISMHCQHGVAFCENAADSSTPTSSHVGFSSITLSALGGSAWSAGDFALDLIGSVNGTVTFSFFNNGNPLTVIGPSTLAIDATGQNQYNFLTSNGQFVTDIVITSTSPLNLADIKQVSLQPSDVPEPASLILLGTSLAGLGLIRRRRAH